MEEEGARVLKEEEEILVEEDGVKSGEEKEEKPVEGECPKAAEEEAVGDKTDVLMSSVVLRW